MHGAAYSYICISPLIYNHPRWMNSSMNSYAAEIPAILDNFIYQIINTISTSIELVHGSHRFPIQIFNSEMTKIESILSSLVCHKM